MRKEWSSFPDGLVLAQSCRKYDTIMSPHWCQAACTTPHDLIPQWLRTILKTRQGAQVSGQVVCISLAMYACTLSACTLRPWN